MKAISSFIPRYIKIIQCVIFVTLLSSCDMDNQKLLIVNHFDRKIYYHLYTDTVLYKDLYVYPLAKNDSIFPHFVRGLGEGVWEYEINTSSIDSTLHVFVFKIDTVTNNKLTEEIIQKKQYTRLDLNVKELEKMNWRLEVK